MNTKLPISLDILLLLVLVAAQAQLGAIHILLVVPFLLSIILELLYPISGLSHLPLRLAQRLGFHIRFASLLVMISVATVLPTLQNINARLETAPDETGFSPALENLHDGALQVELGLQYLDEGKNPYAENYSNTPLRHYVIRGVDLLRNPALDYFVYLPGFLVYSFPAFIAFKFANLPYDQRWLYLSAFVGLILVLPLCVRSPEHKLALMALVGLNPLITAPVSVGMNDVVILFLLVLMAKCILAKRLSLASLFIAIACTFKQSAWFVIPFYLLFLFLSVEPGKRRSVLIKACAIIASVMIVVIAPFAIWNTSAFLTDVFKYPAGMVALNVPIRGYTVGVLLTALGVISTPMSTFPFWILQLVFGIPLLLLLFRYQWRENSLGSLFICAGVFILGLGFLSRFFHQNYLGFVLGLISIGVAIGYANARSGGGNVFGDTMRQSD